MTPFTPPPPKKNPAMIMAGLEEIFQAYQPRRRRGAALRLATDLLSLAFADLLLAATLRRLADTLLLVATLRRLFTTLRFAATRRLLRADERPRLAFLAEATAVRGT